MHEKDDFCYNSLPPQYCSRSFKPSQGRVSNEGSMKSKALGEGERVGVILGAVTGRGVEAELRPPVESRVTELSDTDIFILLSFSFSFSFSFAFSFLVLEVEDVVDLEEDLIVEVEEGVGDGDRSFSFTFPSSFFFSFSFSLVTSLPLSLVFISSELELMFSVPVVFSVSALPPSNMIKKGKYEKEVD
jgi:hypothetical protein